MYSVLLRIESEHTFPRNLTPDVLQALRSVRFIAQHIKDADKDNEVSVLLFINLIYSYLFFFLKHNQILIECEDFVYVL